MPTASTMALWKTNAAGCAVDSLASQAKSCISVELNVEALNPKTAVLLLELPPGGTTIKVLRSEAKQVSKQAFVWHGVVEGVPGSSVTFSRVGGAAVGTITFAGQAYRLRATKGGGRVVELLDSKSIPASGNPPPQRSYQATALVAPYCIFMGYDCATVHNACTTDSPYRIDVMVIYSGNALTNSGGEAYMTAWIALHEYETNRSYRNSGVYQQIRVVHSQSLAYTEAGSTGGDLTALTEACDTGPNSLYEVHSRTNGYIGLRDKFNADAVLLVTHTPGRTSTIGLGQQMRSYHVGDNSFEPCAFAVADILQFLTPSYTFGHELGHVMGAHHDIENADASGGAIPASSYAHIDLTPTGGCTTAWRTMMGHTAEGRVTQWSSADPGITYCDEITGSETKDNASTLNYTAFTVANFRCGSPTPLNVWMKDAWDDTGAEPDPNLTGQPMWKSPYIWVRNAADAGPQFIAQHKHQDPKKGQTNYIYVKVHNSTPLEGAGGGTVGGQLEVLVANASTGLSVTSFTRVALVDMPSFRNHSTEIVQVPWNPIYAGHFCLMARWLSGADPMPVSAAGAVDPYVRGNNNVIWHNVNVIDVATQNTVTVGLDVENPTDSPMQAWLEIVPTSNPAVPLSRLGRISVMLDDKLQFAWSKKEGGGFNSRGKVLDVTSSKGASLQNLWLEPNFKGRLSIVVSRPTDSKHLKSKFEIEVIQYSVIDGKRTVFGGVSYDVYTDKNTLAAGTYTPHP